MPIRMTGLISNMDTESIVKQLMEAQQTKVTKIENKKTKLEWSQDKWKDFQTKLYSLYQNQTSKLRLQANYAPRKATSSDESVVKVSTALGSSAGTHSIAVQQLASAQYVTGDQLASDVTGSTKLSSLGILSGTQISIKSASASTPTVFTVSDNSTINSFISSCKTAGLNASYDATQRRFFIGSKDSGVNQAFTITSNTSNVTLTGLSQADSKTYLGNMLADTATTTSYLALSDADRATFLKNAKDGVTTDAFSVAYKAMYDKTNTYITNITKDQAAQAVRSAIKTAMLNGKTETKITDAAGVERTITGITPTTTLNADTNLYYTNKSGLSASLQAQFDTYDAKIKAEMNKEAGKTLTFTDSSVKAELQKRVNAEYEADLMMNSSTPEPSMTTAINAYWNAALPSAINNAVSNLNSAVNGYLETNGATYNASAEVLDELGIGKVDGVAKHLAGSTLVKAQDCIFQYNDAVLQSSTNTMTVNGLTMEAISVSEKLGDGTYKKTSATVSKDTDATYKMVKDFITQYNDIMKSMNDTYYAKAVRGYEPLTDDEKEAMSDEQIKLWEDKIKGSLLRRDSTLGSIISGMKQAMQGSVKIDGKNYSLSTYGIMTSKDYTEKGLLHIYGDQTDATYSDKDDKLKKALEEDPDTVIKTLTGVVQGLHDTLYKKMQKTSLSSALTFYNDKEIKKQLEDYEDDIDTMEDKLSDMENRYYKQFTAMEKAMAAMQSQQNALSGLLGTK